MIKQKKATILFVTVLILLIIFALFFVLKRPHYQSFSRENAQVLSADEIIALDQINQYGFTCTGAVFDPISNSFYVGDAGKIKPGDGKFEAVIRQISFNFDNQIRFFECYKQFESMRDIQGVTIDTAGCIWFCSYGENLVRGINQGGNPIGAYKVNQPSGIAYDSSDNTFWILTDKKLIHFTSEFNEIKEYSFNVAGQDQLFYDHDHNIIYITAGDDYHGESYVYTFDIASETFKMEYILEDSYAIEGITIINDCMFIFNDGFYHNAELPVNQVNIYHLK